MHTIGPQTLHPPEHNGLIHKELWHAAFTTFDTNFKMSGRFSFLYGGFSTVSSKTFSCIRSQNRSLQKDSSSVLQKQSMILGYFCRWLLHLPQWWLCSSLKELMRPQDRHPFSPSLLQALAVLHTGGERLVNSCSICCSQKVPSVYLTFLGAYNNPALSWIQSCEGSLLSGSLFRTDAMGGLNPRP